MTTTANLTALRAAAIEGDRVAMLLLADVAEAGMDEARADAWRWLADPPAEGWERRAADLVGLAGFGGLEANGAWVKGRGPEGQFPACLSCRRNFVHLRWDEKEGWRFNREGQPLVACRCQDGAREDILAACRLAVGR